MQAKEYFHRLSESEIGSLNKAMEKYYAEENFRSDIIFWLQMLLRITVIVCLIYITCRLTA